MDFVALKKKKSGQVKGTFVWKEHQMQPTYHEIKEKFLGVGKQYTTEESKAFLENL